MESRVTGDGDSESDDPLADEDNLFDKKSRRGVKSYRRLWRVRMSFGSLFSRRLMAESPELEVVELVVAGVVAESGGWNWWWWKIGEGT